MASLNEQSNQKSHRKFPFRLLYHSELHSKFYCCIFISYIYTYCFKEGSVDTQHWHIITVIIILVTSYVKKGTSVAGFFWNKCVYPKDYILSSKAPQAWMYRCDNDQPLPINKRPTDYLFTWATVAITLIIAAHTCHIQKYLNNLVQSILFKNYKVFKNLSLNTCILGVNIEPLLGSLVVWVVNV